MAGCGFAFPTAKNHIGLSAISSGLSRQKQQAYELSRVWDRESVSRAYASYLELAAAFSGSGDDLQSAFCLREASRLSISLGNSKSSVSLLERSLSLEQKRKNVNGEVETLAFLAYVHSSTGNFAASERYLNSAVQSLDRILNKNTLARASYHIGETYYAREDAANFSKYYESSLRLFRDSNDQEGEARTLLSLSYAFIAQGEVGKAVESAQEARNKYESIADVRGRAMSLNALGFSQLKIGEPRNALDSFSAALNLFSKDLDRSEKGTLIYNIGRVHEYFGECDSTIAYYRESLDLFEADGNISFSVGNLWSLGKALNTCGEMDEATLHLREALRLGLSGKKYHDVIGTYVELAKVSEKAGDHSQAEKYYHEALAVLRLMDYGWSRSQVYRGLGNLYLKQGLPTQSRPYYLKSLEIDSSTLDRFDEADSLYNLARLDSLEGNPETALASLEESLKITESLSSNVVNSKLQGSFVSNVFDRYELYINLLMKANRDSRDEAFAVRALQAAERSRARSMLENLALSEANILKDASPETVRQEKETRALLNAKADKLTGLLGSNRDPSEIRKVEAEIEEVRGRLEEIKADLKQKSPIYSAIKDPPVFDVTEFQAKILDGNSLLLEFSLGKAESYLWVVGKTQFSYYVLPPREQIESKIEKLRNLLSQQTKLPDEEIEVFQNRVAEAELEYSREAQALSNELLGQAADKLAGKRLIVVADGKLHYFPLSALPLPNSTTDDPILLSNEVIYEPSAAALTIIRNNAAAGARPQKDLLIISDPVFSKVDARLEKNVDADAGLISTVLSNFRSFSSLETLSRLTASADEAESITKVVGAAGTTAMSGFAANRDSVLNDAISDYRVLHFATHGLVDEERPELSGIVLSLFDKAGNPQNGGFIRLQDVYGMNLNADLVVLSACDTGLGQEIRGEGLISLNNAFLQAGSKSVVSSLWKVEDTATKELMTEFYQGMAAENLTSSQALQRAKIKLRGDPRFRSPFYWASFTALGNFETAPQFSRSDIGWVYIAGLVLVMSGGIFWFWRTRTRRHAH